jgi:hypothetical protein
MNEQLDTSMLPAAVLVHATPHKSFDGRVVLQLLGREVQRTCVLLHRGQHDHTVSLHLIGREIQRIPILLHRGQHDLSVALQLFGRELQRIGSTGVTNWKSVNGPT